MNYRSLLRLMCIAVTFSVPVFAANSRAQSTTSAQTTQSKFRLTRSTSGSKGHEQSGRYIIDDPRTVFKVPDDRQVLVYAEWECTVGQHEFEGHWKNPAGKLVAVSDFKLEVRGRTCSGFFTLLLSETSESGVWTLEAKVDGEATGEHKFQIISTKDTGVATAAEPAKSPGPPPEQPRQPLNESQIYDIANAATVLIERLDARGQRIDSGSGFFVASDVLLTAFQVIDGATKLRVSLPDGRRLETQEALSWNKWEDWAFVKLDAGQKTLIKFSSGDPPVGSRVYALSVSPTGARVIVRCDVVGKNKYLQNGDRINLNCTHPDVTGAPLLDEYGDVIGVVGGSMIPGSGSTRMLAGTYFGASQLLNANPGLVAVPIKTYSKPPSGPTNFAQLETNGTFTAPIVRFENIQYGVLAKRVETKLGPRPMDEGYEFRPADPFIVFLEWRPKEKIKSTATLKILDPGGQVLIEGKPTKLDVKPGPTNSYTWWKADITKLRPGIYRVDVVVDSNAIWRAFFRVRE